MTAAMQQIAQSASHSRSPPSNAGHAASMQTVFSVLEWVERMFSCRATAKAMRDPLEPRDPARISDFWDGSTAGEYIAGVSDDLLSERY